MKGLRRYSMTIFAFLTLKTASSAHNKIFGSKFLSFERLRLMLLLYSELCGWWVEDVNHGRVKVAV